MADGGNGEGKTWQLPRFHFDVDFGTVQKDVYFQEFSGMGTEGEGIEHRASNGPARLRYKMPTEKVNGSVTMKRGIFVGDNTFWNWMSDIRMNTVQPCTVIIRLLNEQGKLTMQWNLANARPTRISSNDLKSDGNEVAVDAIEVAYETMTISN